MFNNLMVFNAFLRFFDIICTAFVPHLYLLRYKFLLFTDYSAQKLIKLNNVEQH